MNVLNLSTTDGFAFGHSNATATEYNECDKHHDCHGCTLNIPPLVTGEEIITPGLKCDNAAKEQVEKRRGIASHHESETPRHLIQPVSALVLFQKARIFSGKSVLQVNVNA